MASSRESASSSFDTFFTREPDSAATLSAKQIILPQSGEATGSPDRYVPQSLAHIATRVPTVRGSRVLVSDSDQNSMSESSASSFGRRPSTDYSESDTGSTQSFFLESGGSAHLISGRERRLPCIFLDCSVCFPLADRRQWYSHSLSHFGQFKPPQSGLCIFCNTLFVGDDPWETWQERMEHIADHFDDGRDIEQSRPDFAFYNHLWSHGLLSKIDYDHIIQFTERPCVEGLRPFNWEPEAGVEKRRRQAQSDWVIYGQQREDRYRKRLALKGGSPKEQVSLPKIRTNDTSRIAIHAATHSLKASDSMSGQHNLHHDLDQSISELADVAVPQIQETKKRKSISSESGYPFSDSRSLIDSLYDSASETSESSQNTSQIDYCRTIHNARSVRCLEISPSSDYDADDDLIHPARYKQQLRTIQSSVFKNSVALVIEHDLPSSVSSSKSQSRDVSVPDMDIDHSKLLQRIKQNIRILQDAGFCQGKLSFLMADSDRADVALLVGVSVDLILSLGLRNTTDEDELGPEVARIDLSECPTRESSKKRVVIHQSTWERTNIKRSLSMEKFSGVLSPAPSTDFGLRVIDPRQSEHRGPSRATSCSTYSKNVEMSSNISQRMRVRELLFRVPDPRLDAEKHGGGLQAHGIVARVRGNTCVINHEKRRDDGEKLYDFEVHNTTTNRKQRRIMLSQYVASSDEKRPYTELGVSGNGDSWNTLLEDCTNLLEVLRIKLSVKGPRHIVYTTLRVLDLIVLSYSRAHISPEKTGTNRFVSLKSFFKISGTQIYSSTNRCRPQHGAITVASRGLRCLDGFLDNKQVWVFHGEQTDPRLKQPLLLSTSPEDFADIWGPMWKMTNHNDSTGILRYDLEHGSIIPIDRSRRNCHSIVNIASDEELCHWVSDGELRSNENLADPAIISKPRLLIGAKRRIRLKENDDCYCEASCITKNLRSACLLHPVGTNKSRRRVDAEAVNGSLGGGIIGLQATYSMITKIDPGRTFKECLLKRWSHDQQRRNPHVLLKRAAVEMSFCTHNSRRIRLVDLFGTKTILKLLDAIDPIKDEECNLAVKEILSHDPAQLIDLYVEKPQWREEIAGLVCSCLETLYDTGIKQDMTQPISLFWMYHHEEYILMLPRSAHRWSGFIQDSLQSCAFVVFEEKCLIMEAERGCQHVSKNGKSPEPNKCDPLLESALVVNERMNQPAGLRLLKKGKTKDSTCWDVSRLERGSVFKMGDSGALEVIRPLSRTRLLVKWLPKNPFKAGFYEFLSRIVEKEPELHHMEYDGEVITGDPLPISIYVIA